LGGGVERRLEPHAGGDRGAWGGRGGSLGSERSRGQQSRPACREAAAGKQRSAERFPPPSGGELLGGQPVGAWPAGTQSAGAQATPRARGRLSFVRSTWSIRGCNSVIPA
jgi:hypothetical protein